MSKTKRIISKTERIIQVVLICFIVYLFSYLILSQFGEYIFIQIEKEKGELVTDYVWKPPFIEWNYLSKKDKYIVHNTNIIGYFYYPLAYLDIECLRRTKESARIHSTLMITGAAGKLLEEFYDAEGN